MKKICEELKIEFDYVIIDCPAGIDRGFSFVTKLASEAIVVVQLDTSSIQDGDRVMGLLWKEDIHNIQIVINRINPKLVSKGISLKIKDVVQWLGMDVCGMIYEDELQMSANNRGILRVLDQYSFTYKCYYAMAKRLLGEDIVVSAQVEMFVALKDCVEVYVAYEDNDFHSTNDIIFYTKQLNIQV